MGESLLLFFTTFMEMFCDLSIAVLRLEQPFLSAAGVSVAKLEAHVKATRACLKNSDDLIMTQFQDTFKLLETACKNGTSLPFDLWLQNRNSLPKMYHKALNMVRGVLNQHTA